MRLLNVLFLCFLVAGLNSGCARHQGPMEKAGERIDEISDNIQDGDAPLKRKGTLEKTGESIDDTLNGRN